MVFAITNVHFANWWIGNLMAPIRANYSLTEYQILGQILTHPSIIHLLNFPATDHRLTASFLNKSTGNLLSHHVARFNGKSAILETHLLIIDILFHSKSYLTLKMFYFTVSLTLLSTCSVCQVFNWCIKTTF